MKCEHLLSDQPFLESIGIFYEVLAPPSPCNEKNGCEEILAWSNYYIGICSLRFETTMTNSFLAFWQSNLSRLLITWIRDIEETLWWSSNPKKQPNQLTNLIDRAHSREKNITLNTDSGDVVHMRTTHNSPIYSVH